jgi:hypothetical protein
VITTPVALPPPLCVLGHVAAVLPGAGTLADLLMPFAPALLFLRALLAAAVLLVCHRSSVSGRWKVVRKFR